MAAERFYIYRCGATNACALIGQKSATRLPLPLAPDHWQFWMQISRHQNECGPYGFDLEAAVIQIAAKGYYLFAGSRKLLSSRVSARSAFGPNN